MEKLLRDADIIVADPLYRPICPGDSIFYELPHVHFRGEYIFENTIVRMQIAICDDEKSIGLILEEKIKKLLPDAVIETYLSGDELIASGCKPDMLFLDIQMPGKNGMETARILRQKDDEVDVAA